MEGDSEMAAPSDALEMNAHTVAMGNDHILTEADRAGSSELLRITDQSTTDCDRAKSESLFGEHYNLTFVGSDCTDDSSDSYDGEHDIEHDIGMKVRSGNSRNLSTENGKDKGLSDVEQRYRDEDGEAGRADHQGSDRDSRCGCFSWRPNFLQVFNNPKGHLFLLCLLGLIQNMTVLGYLNVVITTLERRFRLSSVLSGSVVIAYDISNLIVCAFVGYFGERGRKPVWVGVGSIIFTIGSIIFTLPHFLTGDYQVGVTQEDVCDITGNATSGNLCNDMTSSDESLMQYYWYFIAGQVLHGLGGSTLYTLGITYMDETVPSSHFGLYMGIFTAVNALGPALGFIIGGSILEQLYTDIHLPVSSLTITPDNPVWVGAWWLGFLINAIILLVISLMYLGFPKTMPVSKTIATDRGLEAQAGCEFEAREGYVDSVKAFPLAIWKLIKNVPFMCICGMAVSEWFVYGGLTTFAPKFFESQFNISAGDASFDLGVISVVSGIVGAIFSGYLVKRLKLSVPGLLKMALVCIVISLAAQAVYVFYCPNAPFAGVTVPYDDSNATLDGTNLTSSCNTNCACSETFDPVCGEDNILYYSACHAGCTVKNDTLGARTAHSECSCVQRSSNVTSSLSGGGTVQGGRCSHVCSHQWIFYAIIFISFTTLFVLLVPGWTATLRCVDFSQRGFALGLQTTLYGALGTVPGPIVFGHVIDNTCLIWETECDGSRTCWMYDNERLSHGFLLITMILKSLTFIFCAVALFAYKPSQQVPSEEKALQAAGPPAEKYTNGNTKPYPINT